MARAEAGRDGERQRADALRDRIDVLTAELAVAEQAAEQAHAEAQRADRAEAHAAELHGAVERANAEATLAAQALDAAKAARPRAESLPTRLLRALRGR